MRSRRGMHSTTLDVTRKQRQFLPFTNVRHNLASNFWCLNSILFLGFSWGYQLSYLLDLSSTSIPPPLKYQVSRRWRAHVVFKMSSSKSFDILPDVEKALTGGIGEGMGEVTEHISGHWGQTAAPHWATTAPFGSLSIYFRRFDTYFWTPSNSFSSLSTIYYQRIWHFHVPWEKRLHSQNPSAVWPPSISHLIECFRIEVLTFLLLLSS